MAFLGSDDTDCSGRFCIHRCILSFVLDFGEVVVSLHRKSELGLFFYIGYGIRLYNRLHTAFVLTINFEEK